MCVVSMVSDHYQPLIIPWKYKIEPSIPAKPIDLADLEHLENLIKDYREAVAAATTVDRLTKQSDSIDPEKLKLHKRIEELELEVKELREAIKKLDEIIK